MSHSTHADGGPHHQPWPLPPPPPAAPGTEGFAPAHPSPYGYWGQPAPAYGPPASPYPGYGQPPASSNGLGTAALVLGILGLVLAWVPGLGLLLGIIATTYGAIGYGRAQKGAATNAGSALAGLVTGFLAVLSFFLILILIA